MATQQKDVRGGLVFEYLSDSLIALQAELAYHPRLVLNLQKHLPQDFEFRMAEICAYCDIVLDGDYVQEDWNKLADILLRRLKDKREGRKSILIVNEMPKGIQ